jgi:hypothetical protein
MKSKAIRYAAVALCACLGVTGLALPAAAASTTSTPSPNLIRNAGAERTKTAPTDGGDKVVVRSWSVAKRYYFTAVRYGTPAFLAKQDGGPKNRGKNFFAGGSDGTKSIATQTDSLTTYRSWIKAGKAHFTLSGWLGGYSSQNDHAIVTATWKNKSDDAISTATIGPVSATKRHDNTSLRFRSTDGKVPKSATTALITIRMIRTDGAYNDGYADNLKLVLSKS